LGGYVASTRVPGSYYLFEEVLMTRTRPDYERPRALYMPRSRGAVTGLILILLGAWGALIPFMGPIFNWAYTVDPAWTWTTAKGWLEVLPGVTAAVGGLLLLVAGNRATAMLGGWLAVFAGAWFVVGRTFAATLNIGDAGQPVAPTDLKRALLEVTYFTGLGALIVFLGGAALARVAARHARDVAVAAPAPTAAGPAPYDETVSAAPAGRFAAAETQPRERTGGFFRRHTGGLFRRHHAGV
jgi:hypothetical protein